MFAIRQRSVRLQELSPQGPGHRRGLEGWWLIHPKRLFDWGGTIWVLEKNTIWIYLGSTPLINHGLWKSIGAIWMILIPQNRESSSTFWRKHKENTSETITRSFLQVWVPEGTVKLPCFAWRWSRDVEGHDEHVFQVAWNIFDLCTVRPSKPNMKRTYVNFLKKKYPLTCHLGGSVICWIVLWSSPLLLPTWGWLRKTSPKRDFKILFE